jgi:hypothetical protein
MSENPLAHPQPWYSEGLRFDCTQCGKCCGGAPGFVWMRAEDIEVLCKHLSLDEQEFERRYMRRVGRRWSLVEFPGGECVFLDPIARKCTVYEARPLQCRTWPFWQSNVRTPADWQRTCEVCPGSGQGKLYSLETVQAQVDAMKL